MADARTGSETERIAEARQAWDDKRYARWLTEVPVPIAVHIGPDHRFALCNQRYEQVFGAKGYRGRALIECFPQWVPNGVKACYDRCYQSGETVTRVEVAVDPTAAQAGSGYVLDLVLQPVLDAEGRVEGVLTCFHDVTEPAQDRRYLEQVSQELRRALDERDAIIGQLTDGVIVTDAAGVVRTMNQVARAMLGLRTEREIVHPFSDYAERYELRDLDGEVIPIARWPVSLTLAGATFAEYEVWMFDRFTGRRWLASYGGTAVRDDQGAVVLSVLTVRDVTQQYRMTRELEESTRELARSNEELEGFASAVAHDLQSPLRSISLNLELLASAGGELDEAGHKPLANAIEAAQRMRELIEALLEYGRLGSDSVQLAPVDLADPIRDARENLAADFDTNRARLVIADDLPTVWGNRLLLTQAFQNLIGNALRHAGAAPTIDIRASICPDGQWSVRVRDDGPGIPAEHHARIFDAFYRIAGAGSGGSGLGLAMVRKMVELCGGSIRVQSQPSRGTSFEMFLRSPPSSAVS